MIIFTATCVWLIFIKHTQACTNKHRLTHCHKRSDIYIVVVAAFHLCVYAICEFRLASLERRQQQARDNFSLINMKIFSDISNSLTPQKQGVY